MIENKSLRSSNIHLTNDPNELIHGYHYVYTLLSEQLKETMRIHIDGLDYSFHKHPTFIFCLSELNDNMHLWEKYGDEHKGIRIGFCPFEIITYWRLIENNDVILSPVIYQDYNGKFIGPYAKHFENCFFSFVKFINQLQIENKLDDNENYSLKFCLSILSTIIKRREWELEKEWRIICLPLGQMHESIIGNLSTGNCSIQLENKTEKTFEILTNKPHHAPRDILKIGSQAGKPNLIGYAIQLLFKKYTGGNCFDGYISQSNIITK